MCDCVDVLKAQARAELIASERAGSDKRTRPHALMLRRRYTALGWAAGVLTAHQRRVDK